MDVNVVFWNLENLFDTVSDPISNDFDFRPEKSWTPAVQQRKVANLASDPPVVTEVTTVDADVFDSDLMITSAATRRPKGFEFEINGGVASHNDGYSDHFPMVTILSTA